MTFRDNLVLSCRRWAIRLFLLMFVYPIVAKVLGNSLVKPEYAFVFFALSLLAIAFVFLPPKIRREYTRAWVFFISFAVIALLVNLFVFSVIVFDQHPSDTVMTCGGFLFLLSIITLLITAFIKDETHIGTKEIVPRIKEIFSQVAKKLHLHITDQSTRSTLIQSAGGNSIYGHLKLEFWNPKSYILSQKTPVAFITLYGPMPNINLVLQNEALEVTNVSKQNYEKVEHYLSQKDLKDFNFIVKGGGDSLRLEFSAMIEEESLWIDLIELLVLIKGLPAH